VVGKRSFKVQTCNIKDQMYRGREIIINKFEVPNKIINGKII